MTLKLVVILASVVQLGFGVWHFFVPGIWRWYDHMEGGELAIAVRAINFFFSFCLVLMGLQTILLVLHERWGSFPLRVALGGAAALWAARVAMQLVFPQGTISTALRYGLLATFVLECVVFLAAFVGASGSAEARAS